MLASRVCIEAFSAKNLHSKTSTVPDCHFSLDITDKHMKTLKVFNTVQCVVKVDMFMMLAKKKIELKKTDTNRTIF